MSSTVLYMSMSLDGFIAGPHETPKNPLGDGGYRLHDWDFTATSTGAHRVVHDEYNATGAIVAGAGTFEPADGWDGDHHGVPIYILSRRPRPDWTTDWPLVHYGSDLDAAFRNAKESAGDKNVLVHGAAIAQRALKAGLLDELVIHLIPVLLGEGRSLFGHGGIGLRELQRVRVLEGDGGVTHLHFRVSR